jgi:hypothetical protein
VFLPGVSYLFTWPLLFGLLGFGYVLLREKQETTKSAVVFAIVAVPGVLLLAPAIHLIFVALTVSLSGVAAIMIVLLLGLMIPLMSRMGAVNKWLLPGTATALGVIYIVFAGLTLRTSPTYPKPNNLFYCLNADTGQGLWASVDTQPDEWTSKYFTAGTERGPLTECLPQSSRTFLKSKAGVAQLDAPRAELISNQQTGEMRTLQLRLTSPRGANAISIFFEPGAEIVNASINGKPALSRSSAGAKQGWYVYYYALPPEGAVLTLETKSATPLTARVVDLSYELPSLSSPPKRPDHLIPSAYFVSDATLAGRSFTF